MSARPGQIDALKRAIAAQEAGPVRPAPAAHDIDTVRRAVAAAIATVSGCPAEHVREAQSLSHDLGMKVLDVVELLLAVETALGLPPLPSASLRTVRDVVRAAMQAAPG